MADDLGGGARPALTPPESLAARVASIDRLTPVLAAVLFAGAIGLLHHELAAYSYHDVTRALAAVRPNQLVWAIVLTVLAYAVLPGYDAMALSYIGHPLPLRRTAFGSFISYAFSQTLGFPPLAHSAVAASSLKGRAMSWSQATTMPGPGHVEPGELQRSEGHSVPRSHAFRPFLSGLSAQVVPACFPALFRINA